MADGIVSVGDVEERFPYDTVAGAAFTIEGEGSPGAIPYLNATRVRWGVPGSGGGTGAGDVSRTGTTQDNRIARWDSTTATIQTSVVTINDSGNMSGIGTITGGSSNIQITNATGYVRHAAIEQNGAALNDLLGWNGSAWAPVAITVSGSNTGDVTLAGENYLSIAGQIITANPVNLSGTNVTGTLAAGRFPALTGDVTTTAGSLATTIAANAVTLAKMAQMATASFLGRNTASTGNVEVLSTATVKTMLNLTGTNSGDQTITLTGDVTGTGTGSFAATIANNAVTLAKMATMATASILGRNTAGTGNPEVLSASTTKSLLSLNNVENTALSTWAGSTNITTLGTVATGTWNATTIAVNKGGTGLTSGTAGGVLYYSATGTLASTASLVSGVVFGGGASGPYTLTNLAASGSDFSNTTGKITGAGGIVGTAYVQTNGGFFTPGTTSKTVSSNTFAIDGTAYYIKIGSGAATLNTITGGSDGQEIVIRAAGFYTITIAYNFGTDGFYTQGLASMACGIVSNFRFRYEGSLARWIYQGA